MKKLTQVRALSRAAMALVMAVSSLIPAPSYAALKCEELVAQRSCMDSAPKNYTLAGGSSVMVAAPVISGYSTPCWSWNRKFQCVESEPQMYCDSGTPYQTVKNSCSLTAAAINSTVKINSISYITDATYTYRCAFGQFTTNDTLPTGKECVLLDSTTSQSNYVAAASAGAAPSTGYGNPPTTTALTGSVATTETKVDNYVCYGSPKTTCSDICYEQVVDKATGTIAQKEVACTSPVTNCTSTVEQCGGTLTQQADGSFSATAALGPDGRCLNSTEKSICQAGTVPRCLDKSNCKLTDTSPSSVQDNGVALTQEQTYVCSNETKSCTQYADVSNCVHAGAWGWDQMTISGQIGQGLGEYNQAMSKIEGIQKGMKDNDPYIFSGQNLRCHYAVGNFMNTFITIAIIAATMWATGGASAGLLQTALQSGAGMTAATAQTTAIAIQVGASFASDAPNSKAFGSNCCKDYVIEGSDAWYKLGACNADEVKLAVARRKGLYHYLGEYCSKKSGFPLRQCVEKTKSYCAFDDMLALVVNEQGRAQLDAISKADVSTTKSTGPKSFPMFSPEVAGATKYSGVMNNGKWVQRSNQYNSQVWTWQYPGYCQTSAKQKVAYDLYMDEVNAALSLQGIQPDKITQQQALDLIVKAVKLPAFQECADTPGMLSFLTCSKNDDSCDVTKLPEGPTGVEVDISGSDVSQADINWRIQQMQSFYNPGDYGVTGVMASNSTFAAVSASVNEFVTATGSCHTDGACLYDLAVTDKTATGGLGARKRSKDYAKFPLYTATSSAAWPAVTYVAKDGTFDAAAYQADPNRGLGTPLAVGTQRFIFRPNYITAATSGNIHTKVLLEYANEALSPANPENDYKPLMVPTSLAPATSGWYPYGDAADNTKHFYMSGGCDPNSRWCNYEIEVDLTVPRHPWGSAESPRCWGFSLDQMAALDFDKMDLSRWINSLDLSAASAGLSADAAKAMTDQVTSSAQSFYSAFKDGSAVNKPGAGSVALVTNTDILPKLSNDNYEAYTLQAAVPANWPNWFDDQPNTNPVTNVRVNWGDGSPVQTMPRDVNGRAYTAKHDYGDKPAGTYTITVTMDTLGNGPQRLTTNVTVAPNAGDAKPATQLNFNNPGSAGAPMGTYTPSATQDGTSMAPANLETLSPGTVQQFNQQGSTVAKPTTP